MGSFRELLCVRFPSGSRHAMRLPRRGAIVTHKEFNGWTNYETWCLKLWIDNEEGSSRYWDDVAQEVYNEAQADTSFTRDERATLDLSDRLKSEFEEAQPELGAS